MRHTIEAGIRGASGMRGGAGEFESRECHEEALLLSVDKIRLRGKDPRKSSRKSLLM